MRHAVAITASALIAAVMITAQEAQAAPCLPVSGGITVNVVGTTPVRALGPVTGTLAGATQAVVLAQTPQPDGSIKLSVSHDFVTDDRSWLKTEDNVTWTPIPGRKGVFAMQTTYRVKGGSGRFAKATGTFENQGEADTNAGLLTLTYRGSVCGVD